LIEGEIFDTGVELVGGTIQTAINVVTAPLDVVSDTFSAIGSWFD